MSQPNIKLFTDGASRGNPGRASAGAVAYTDTGEKIFTLSKYLGEKLTNNYAEYQAMILGLGKCLSLGYDKVVIFSDSELIVRQLTGRYKVKNANIRPSYEKLRELVAQCSQFDIKHILREKNKEADYLANQALDGV